MFCKHTVRYIYNGIEQEEVFDARQILHFCKSINYPISEHFSVLRLIKNYNYQHIDAIPADTTVSDVNDNDVKKI